MIISEQQKDIARWAVDCASKNGCSAARVSIVISGENSFEYRNDQLDKLQQSTENKLFIELFAEGRYASFSTNRMERNELESFIREGIASTKLLSADLCRQLPDPMRYYKEKSENLELFDESYINISTEQKIELAKQSVDEVYRSDKRIISVSSYFGDGYSAEYMIASNGFEAETRDTAYSLSAEVSLKTDADARPEAYWSESNIFWNDLIKTGISSKALQRAIGKIGQQKISSGKYTMLLDNQTASRLLSPMISAMFGASLQQKNSFLLNKLGETIASPLLSVTDTPHLKRNFGARSFDGEGVATCERNIIEKGVLNTYFIDTYNSLKMNVEPSISSPSILTFEAGKENFDALLKSIDKGIWVTGFNGGNSNPTTGDFSFGIEGFLIEHGQIGQAVGEMNITGNMLSLWANLIERGNDLRPNSSWRIPSLMFSDVSFSGL